MRATREGPAAHTHLRQCEWPQGAVIGSSSSPWCTTQQKSFSVWAARSALAAAADAEAAAVAVATAAATSADTHHSAEPAAAADGEAQGMPGARPAPASGEGCISSSVLTEGTLLQGLKGGGAAAGVGGSRDRFISSIGCTPESETNVVFRASRVGSHLYSCGGT